MLDVHKQFECPERLQQCFLCKDYIKAKEIVHHKQVLCPMREVECRNVGCAKILSLGVREEHERKSCKFRTLSCPQGCGMDVPWIQHGKHTKMVCAMRQAPCPLGCGTVLRHHMLQEHCELDCVRRHQQQNAQYGSAASATSAALTSKETAAAAAKAKYKDKDKPV